MIPRSAAAGCPDPSRGGWSVRGTTTGPAARPDLLKPGVARRLTDITATGNARELGRRDLDGVAAVARRHRDRMELGADPGPGLVGGVLRDADEQEGESAEDDVGADAAGQGRADGTVQPEAPLQLVQDVRRARRVRGRYRQLARLRRREGLRWVWRAVWSTGLRSIVGWGCASGI